MANVLCDCCAGAADVPGAPLRRASAAAVTTPRYPATAPSVHVETVSARDRTVTVDLDTCRNTIVLAATWARYRQTPMIPSISQIWNDGRAVARARWYLRHADVIGARVRLNGHPRVINLGRMQIADRVRLDSTTATLELVSESGGLLDIEERVFLNFGCSLAATKLIRIGARSLLGPHCMLMDNSYHHVEPERRQERPDSQPIILEPNVWLGPRTIVLPGVTIGEGACIGAGSVVTKDIPPRTLAVGVPARPIRSL